MSLKLKPAVDFDETWSVLKKTVKDVVTMGNVPREVWYKGINEVLSLCMDKSESEPESEMPLIAGKLHQETKKLLKEHVESLYIQVNGTSQEQLLTVYYTLWQQYSQGIDYLDMLYS
jgi:cullin 2